jgi:ribosomal-protein-alanine N-acetyltransferase
MVMKKLKLIFLKKLNIDNDVGNRYLHWMNDKEVFKFTEQKNKQHSLEDIKKFVKEKNKSNNEFLYGIFLKKKNSKKHIGNIKIGPINFRYKSADLSYFIGEKNLWGKGYTVLAIQEIIKIAEKKKLKKLRALAHIDNIGSQIVLIKNGFKKKGIYKKIKTAEVYYKEIKCI